MLQKCDDCLYEPKKWDDIHLVHHNSKVYFKKGLCEKKNELIYSYTDNQMNTDYYPSTCVCACTSICTCKCNEYKQKEKTGMKNFKLIDKKEFCALIECKNIYKIVDCVDCVDCNVTRFNNWVENIKKGIMIAPKEVKKVKEENQFDFTASRSVMDTFPKKEEDKIKLLVKLLK